MDDPNDAIANVLQLRGAWLASDLLLPIREDEAPSIASAISPSIVDLFARPKQAAGLFNELFHAEGFWRDQVALTWSLRTFYTAS